MFTWFSWLGRITPKQRAASEVEEIDRQLYDADLALHNAQTTLIHLRGRREHLVAEYDLDPLPAGDNIPASGTARIRPFVGDGSHNLHNPHHIHGG